VAAPDEIELVFNLWYRVDAPTGFTLALYGKTYALRGTNERKLETLQELARSDFVTARTFTVPERFSVVFADGTAKRAAHASAARDELAGLFEEVFKALEAEVPSFAVFNGGKEAVRRLRGPENPLCVKTCLMVTDDGKVHPVTG